MLAQRRRRHGHENEIRTTSPPQLGLFNDVDAPPSTREYEASRAFEECIDQFLLVNRHADMGS